MRPEPSPIALRAGYRRTERDEQRILGGWVNIAGDQMRVQIQNEESPRPLMLVRSGGKARIAGER